jgi:hypothetical protein
MRRPSTHHPQFSIVSRETNGNVTGVQNPYAEVDF